MDDATQSTPTRDARLEFAARFRLLHETAGSPALKSLASRASMSLLTGDSPRAGSVSPQRLSDWRTGRNVPAKFEGLAATLRVLIAAARRRRPEPPARGLYSMVEWQNLWNQALTSPAIAEKGSQTRPKPAAKPDSERLNVCPFPGLTPLSDGDADFYFGRAKAISTLVERFTGNLGSRRLTFVVGASGSGKSSLLQAGFAVAIGAAYTVVTMTPGSRPTQALTEALGSTSAGNPRVLVVDQFEEIFTTCDDVERAMFISMLTELCDELGAPDGFAGVVVAVRSDFYQQCVELPTLTESLVHNQMVLSRMSRAALTSAIVGPATAVGLSVADGLVDVILSDLGVTSRRPTAVPSDPGVLPLLAHALNRTWEARTGNTLTIAGYRETGGVHGAIMLSAEDRWSQFTDTQRDVARDLLLHMIHIGEDGRGTRRHVPTLELRNRHPEAPAILDALGQARIVSHDEHGTTLAHEAVIEAWPRLSQWLDDDREDVLRRQRVDADAREWRAHDHERSLLYSGARLAAARDWQKNSRSPVSPTTAEFLNTARAFHRRGARIRRGLVLLLVLLLLTTATAALVAVRQQRDADADRSDAQFNALLAQAALSQSVDPTASARLSLAAAEQRPDDPRPNALLMGTQTSALATVVDGHEGAVYDVAINNRNLVATASYDRTIRLWKENGTGLPAAMGQPLSGHQSWVTSVEYSTDGNTLFSGDGNGAVQVWDVSDPVNSHLRSDTPLTGHIGAVYQIAVRPEADGVTRWIATAGDDHTARLWNLETGETRVLAGHTDALRTLDFSPDGNTLVTGSDDRTAIVWDTTNPSAPEQLGAPLTGYDATVHAVSFSPDGSLLATASDDQTIRMWSMADRAAPTPVGPPTEAHTAAIWSMEFNYDGSLLATASWDGTAKVWSLTDPARPVLLGQPLTGSSGGLTTVTFGGEGGRLITGGQDGAIRFWTLPAGTVLGHTGRVAQPAFNASGSRMATGSRDGTVRLWDTTEGSGPRPIALLADPAGPQEIENIALSGDGRTLAYASLGTGQVRLWDVSDPAAPRPRGSVLNTRARYTHELAFSPDSRSLVTAFDDQTVQIWNLADPAKAVPSGAPLTGPQGWINDVAYSPDGRYLAAASSDKNLHLWDLQRGGPLSQVYPGHSGPINSVAISPDSKWAATGSDDQTIRLWKLDAPESVTVELTGHDSTVRSVSFDPTGTMLASGSDDQTVRMWDLRNITKPTAIGRTVTPPGTVRWKVAFSPDGEHLAGAGENGALRWWTHRVTADTALCQATAGGMTEDKWKDLMPDIPYRETCSEFESAPG
ncbi:UNVERIFIED_CONTAM: WD40 repeat protein [Williamsia faeni]